MSSALADSAMMISSEASRDDRHINNSSKSNGTPDSHKENGDAAKSPGGGQQEKQEKDIDKKASNPSPSTPLPSSSLPPPSSSIEALISPPPPGSELMDPEASPFPKRTSVFSKGDHEDTDDFMLSTMLAIRTAVLAGTKDATKVEAAPEDFTSTRKHKISMAGDRKVEVKDYAPVIFTLIRRKFGISIPTYLLSWSDSRLAKSRSVGKSDSMFIMSPDNKFVLKTLGGSEAKRLNKILQPYYTHLTTYKDTFLSRIYGLHRLKRRGQSNVYFAIFNNVFDTGLPLTEIYDLKGSTVGRRALAPENPPSRRSSTSFDFKQIRKAISEQPKKPTVLKDLDFTRQLHMGNEARSKVLAQLTIDCKFLSQHMLMDYSLLIGVRRTDTTGSSTETTPTGSPALPRNATPGSSPDLRVGAIANSPRQRHSFIVPSSVPEPVKERVPGLLFFLESTKATSTKTIRENKRDRRKSLLVGSGKSILAPSEELNAIDEEDQDNSSADDKPAESNTTDTPQPESTNPPQSTPPLTSPLSTQVQLKDTEELETDDSDTKDDGAPDIAVIPPSPMNRRKKEKAEDQPANSSVQNSTSTSSPDKNANGHVHTSTEDTPKTPDSVDDDDTSDDNTSISDSPTDSPRQSLGLLTVSSVPNFSYFGPGGAVPRAASASSGGLRFSSAQNSPNINIMKRPGRSASLNYVNLDPLCEPPYIPFYKVDDGGIKGNSLVALDPKKSNEIYFIGVIDFLQKYNAKKKFAGFAKSLKYEKEELSTVDPVFYMERFLKMAERAIAE